MGRGSETWRPGRQSALWTEQQHSLGHGSSTAGRLPQTLHEISATPEPSPSGGSPPLGATWGPLPHPFSASRDGQGVAGAEQAAGRP